MNCVRLLPWALLTLSVACSPLGVPDIERPNIVLIIGDDHDYRDFGFMGSDVAHTPTLDRLAAAGTVFDLAYSTASVCRPSLRTLLTGLHPLEYRMHEVQLHRDRRIYPDADRLMSALHTLPSRLADVGYKSFQAGKYSDGSFREAGFTEGMLQRSTTCGLQCSPHSQVQWPRSISGVRKKCKFHAPAPLRRLRQRNQSITTSRQHL